MSNECTLDRVVVVDEDPATLRLISRALGALGCEIRTFESSRQAATFLDTDRADLLVTDQLMPELTGLELVEKARARDPTLAAVIVSGQVDRAEVRAAFHLGVADVLFKPFTIPDLLESARFALHARRARIERYSFMVDAWRAVERLRNAEDRALPTGAETIQREGKLELHPETRTFTLQGQPLDLTGIEHAVLELLMQRRRQVVTHQEMRRHLGAGDEPKAVASELVRGHIKHLRQKIEPDPGRPRYLRTVWGRGYTLAFDVEPQPVGKTPS